MLCQVIKCREMQKNSEKFREIQVATGLVNLYVIQIEMFLLGTKNTRHSCNISCFTGLSWGCWHTLTVSPHIINVDGETGIKDVPFLRIDPCL